MMLAAALRACIMSVPVTWYRFLLERNVLTVVFGDVPGYFVIRLTILDQAMTGQRILSCAHCMVIVSFLSPFFWSSKVMAT